MLIRKILQFLQTLAPLELAEDWDNVGLLIGSEAREAKAVMTCLTLSPDVAREAIDRNAQLIVTHHPVLFRAVKRLTDATSEGRMLVALIQAGISVYSPHTGYDSAHQGINRQLAQMLGLRNVQPLRPKAIPQNLPVEQIGSDPVPGAGRFGDLPQVMSLAEFVDLTKRQLGIQHTQYVGQPDVEVCRVAIACGSAAEFIPDAVDRECDVLLTGEARFHACLEAIAESITLVLPGHFATERPALVRLAGFLKTQFPELLVWASEVETDPVQWG